MSATNDDVGNNSSSKKVRFSGGPKSVDEKPDLHKTEEKSSEMQTDTSNVEYDPSVTMSQPYGFYSQSTSESADASANKMDESSASQPGSKTATPGAPEKTAVSFDNPFGVTGDFLGGEKSLPSAGRSTPTQPEVISGRDPRFKGSVSDSMALTTNKGSRDSTPTKNQVAGPDPRVKVAGTSAVSKPRYVLA